MAVNPIRRNLDVSNFIDIKPDQYKKTKVVFEGVFSQLKVKMEETCEYFKSYYKEILYAGSVSDKTKIMKLDEFQINVVIRLPVNYREIEIEDCAPAFVRMKIKELDHLNKKNWEARRKVTRFWLDGEHYFLQNKFRQWMHGLVRQAAYVLNNRVIVNDVTYAVKYREIGPDCILNIRNVEGNEEFKLDVDLVPVIRFMYPRCPPGPYRTLPEQFYWLVEPKPNRILPQDEAKNRCWRLSFEEYERHMMKTCYNLNPTIKLVKKLRDSLQLRNIASYHIKTLFLWKIHETTDRAFWQRELGVLFRVMVEKLCDAIQNRNIPYFWNENFNMIENVRPAVLDTYASSLRRVLHSIDANDVEEVASYLLTASELQELYEPRINH